MLKIAISIIAWLSICPLAVAQIPGSLNGGRGYVVFTAASNNSQIIGIPGPHLISTITALNTTAAAVYLKIYDSSSAPDCTSTAGLVGYYPVAAVADGGGFTVKPSQTVLNGLGICVVGAFGSTDNTNAATGTSISWVLQ